MLIRQARLIIVVLLIVACNKISAQCSKEEILRQKRSAFVVGINSYKENPLFNSINDAIAVRNALRRLNFKPILDTNCDLRTLKNDLIKWVESLRKVDIAIFYFAGHGAQIDGINYLYPIDAIFSNDINTVKRSTYSATFLQEQMQALNKHFNVLILDACRDNPTRNTKLFLTKKGLTSSRTTAPGTLVSYPIQEGETVPDFNGKKRNSLFVQALVHNLELPDQTINSLFLNVYDQVDSISNHTQQPFVKAGIGNKNNFCLTPADPNNLSTKKDFFSDTTITNDIDDFKFKNQYSLSELPDSILTQYFSETDNLVRNSIYRILDSLGMTGSVSSSSNPEYYHNSDSWIYNAFRQHHEERQIQLQVEVHLTEFEFFFKIEDRPNSPTINFSRKTNINPGFSLEFPRANIQWAEISDMVIRYIFERREILLIRE
ncbi:MAG TPA: caspase family protein [Puia sp.]|nr:caspase family protein [Puia sp.]